ncbi:MAG TPA: DUF2155 domain-containing protein [Sphingomonadales bacterium]|nr:DUF2155 domain-containing protein [Sphingomonadales bacterium]
MAWFRIFLAVAMLTLPAAAQEEEGPKPATHDFTAVVGALDKITARITRLDLAANQGVRFGTLTLTARACYARPPVEPPETYIFLEIDDTKANGEVIRVFTGWMLASSPALNPLEHAVYDVWAISCNMR